MKKIHIMIVEKQEHEIEFFQEALGESGLSFFCTVARSTEQALRMLKSNVPDVVFIDVNAVDQDGIANIKQLKSRQAAPLILYSNTTHLQPQRNFADLNYVQLPKSIRTMANVFKNLFIENTVTQ